MVTNLPDSDAGLAGLTTLEAAIVRTLAYVDVFDYPLTAAEVHRYLIGAETSRRAVDESLSNGRLLPHRLQRHPTAADPQFTLPGRSAIITTRARRETASRQLWPTAIKYGRMIGQMPFVQMVAVTGSLAVNNTDREADIDYLIVTDNNRVWLCRALVILIVRRAARLGIHLCPNYFLAARAMDFTDRNLYTAREIVQMVPIVGLDIYRKLRETNRWTQQFLPNANGAPPAIPDAIEATIARAPHWRGIESLLASPLGTPIESWEMGRKIRRFQEAEPTLLATTNGAAVDAEEAGEADFTPDWCKGHFHAHARRVLHHYENSLTQPSDANQVVT